MLEQRLSHFENSRRTFQWGVRGGVLLAVTGLFHSVYTNPTAYHERWVQPFCNQLNQVPVERELFFSPALKLAEWMQCEDIAGT